MYVYGCVSGSVSVCVCVCVWGGGGGGGYKRGVTGVVTFLVFTTFTI